MTNDLRNRARHFLRFSDHDDATIDALVESALRFKRGADAGRPLAGKAVGLCFMNPSVRTQSAFAIAAAQLGAQPVTLSFGGGSWKMEHADGVVMDGDRAEHLADAVPVLSGYCAALGLRAFPEGRDWSVDRTDPVLEAFARHATVPVVNLESATCHPSQALADLMTLRETMEPKGKRFLLAWAPHVKPLPLAVPQSAAEMAALAGMHVSILRPEGYDLAPEAMARVAALCAARGTELTVSSDPERAYRGAHVVYAKSWGSLARYGEPPPQDAAFRARWLVDVRKMALGDGARFMHCLPVRRNLVAADAVIDAPGSLVQRQANNRLHTAKAILAFLARVANSKETVNA